MKIKEFFIVIIKSFNPDSYKELTKKKLGDAFHYLFFILILSMLLSGFIFLMKFNTITERLDKIYSQFDSFKVSFDVVQKQPVLLINDPKIVLDLTKNQANMTDEDYIITKEHLYRKKFDPDIMNFKLYSIETISLEQYEDLVTYKDKVKKFIVFILIILVPSAFLFLFTILSFKYLVEILIVTLLGVGYSTIKRYNVKSVDILKLAIYTSTLMILLELVSKPLFNLGILPLVVYLILFFVGLFMIQDRKFKVRKEKEE
ncbi:DUF1189 family protein [Candidatus Woesearchaeota archaeon]|nr:DUF1189 family protein [Candidatus Woesearchaeota archaeon]